MRREVIQERKINRSKGPSVGRDCPNMRHEKIMALGRDETAERESRDRGTGFNRKGIRISPAN